jgi:antitoxin component HigA of HigAB toxin-antitoxin module
MTVLRTDPFGLQLADLNEIAAGVVDVSRRLEARAKLFSNHIRAA